MRPSREKSNVVSITAYRNRDLVNTLRSLLDQAESGEITGLLYTARIGKTEHGVGACGEYADDPIGGLAAITLASDTLTHLIRANQTK